METLLQWLAGGFYLLNKVFLSFSEHAHKQGNEVKARKWRIASWTIYLAGLPPWVIVFISQNNWIAASLEASGAPAMILGLVTALRGQAKKPPRWLDLVALVCIAFGFAKSLYHYGGLKTISQFLEIGLVTGFLVGTYLLAKERSWGYLWFILMHISCGWLMWIQGYPWLFLQQVISLAFIADAYLVARRRQSVKTN